MEIAKDPELAKQSWKKPEEPKLEASYFSIQRSMLLE